MTGQWLLAIALGLLLGLIAGAVAFLVVRVVPIVWQRTGVSAWVQRRIGIDLFGSALVAVLWVTRNWFLWVIIMLFWQAILAPPVTFLVLRFLVLPSLDDSGAAHGPPLTLGILVSYASYVLCAVAYWSGYRKARQMHA